MLAAGVLQGSDGKENMSGVGEKQTPKQTGQDPKGKQLDPYSMLQVAQHMDAESTKTVQETNSKFATDPSTREIQGHGKLFNQLKMNSSPVTAENYKLYSNIQTQQIFGPNDYIIPNVDKYIFSIPCHIIMEDLEKKLIGN